MEILRLDKVAKHYPKFDLKDVSFSLESGRIMGFVGRNGAGKTTTLKAIMNIIHLDGGHVTVFGKDLDKDIESIKGGIGFMNNGTDFFPAKKVEAIAEAYSRFFPNWDHGRFSGYLAHFGIDRNKKLNELSQGMKIKFLLSLALSHDARLLILDEPTTGLDPIAREEILSILLEVVKNKDRAVLFSTHITSDLDKVADDVTYIRNGEIVFSEDRDRLIAKYRTLEIAEDSFSDELKARTIAHKTYKSTAKALVSADDAGFFKERGIALGAPTIEDIVVFLEGGETENEEFAL